MPIKYDSKDFIGKKFNKWTIVEWLGLNKDRHRLVRCQCECGRFSDILLSDVKGNRTPCCIRCAQIKHGGSYSRLYKIWHSMRSRCYCKSHLSYKNYGGRGIKICDEWQDFDIFAKWAQDNGYDPNAKRSECTLDRIDVNGDYCPENCRFVPMLIQVVNQRISSRNTSGYVGIVFVPKLNKWHAKIGIGYKNIHLKDYDTQKEALAVRNKYIEDHNLPHKIQEYKGEIGNINK